MIVLFVIAFLASFVGSIPPGTINLRTVQYAMQGRKEAAVYFGLAAVLVEFVYATIAVRFQIFLSSNLELSFWFKVVSGSVLIFLGLVNLLKKHKAQENSPLKEKRNAFVKGLLIGVANPLSIPFWLMVTTYLDAMSWIDLDSNNFWIYVTGISTGTFALLLLVTHYGAKFQRLQHNTFILYRIPGLILILTGGWTFISG